MFGATMSWAVALGGISPLALSGEAAKRKIGAPGLGSVGNIGRMEEEG